MSLKKIIINGLLITIGSIIVAIGINGILLPHRFLNGGVIGVALIIHYLADVLGVGALYFILNIPFFLLGWFSVSRKFMFFTVYSVAIFSLLTQFLQVPAFPVTDPILAAVLAGVICGLGSGLILRTPGSSGGIDILAVYLNKRFGLRLGWTLFMVNALILAVAALLFSLEMALYTAIFVFTQGKLVDAVVTGFNKRKTMIIISDKAAEISQDILEKLNRGVTFLDGSGAYTGQSKKIIFSVVTMTEMPRIKEMVFSRDPNAFMVINEALDVLGYRHGHLRVY